MTVLSVSFSGQLGEVWEDHIKLDLRQIKNATTATMHEGRDLADPLIRADIKGAGDFSKRWYGKALKIVAFPKLGVGSIKAAINVSHKIPYAGVFEDGTVIHGAPFMWLPLGAERVGARGSNRLTPRNFEAKTGQDLFSFPGANGELLLGFKGRVGNKQGRAPKRVTIGVMKRGTDGAGGSIATIPVFVGIRTSRIGKRFHIREILETRVAPLLPDLYLKNMEALDG